MLAFGDVKLKQFLLKKLSRKSFTVMLLHAVRENLHPFTFFLQAIYYCRCHSCVGLGTQTKVVL